MDQQTPLSGMKVAHLMSSNLISVDEDDPVSFVIKMFDHCHISGAPVTNRQGEYVGVISKTDLFDRRLLEFLHQAGNLDDLPVRYVMNPQPPIGVPAETSVEKAAEMMLAKRIHRLFVQDEHGRMVGVVSSYDILRVVASNRQAAEENDLVQRKEQQILCIREQLQKQKNKRRQVSGAS